MERLTLDHARAGSAPVRGPAEPPLASIVIRTRNEQALLGETLARVQGQSLRDFEILVVDSGSTDRTLEIARESPGVRVLEMPPEEFTFGRALNVGARHTAGRILVFLSAHALPASSEWLAQLLRHFRDDRVAGVWGSQGGPPARPRRRVVRQELSAFLANVYFGFSNANGAVRRSVWERYPFHEGLPGGEDKEWAYRVLSDGYVLVHDGEAFVHHHHDESPRRIWWRHHREHVGLASFLPGGAVGLRTIVGDLRAGLRAAWKRARRDPRLVHRLPGEAAGLLAAALGRYTGSRHRWRGNSGR